MARLRKTRPASGHRVVVIDDDPQLLHSTRLLMEMDGHEVFASSDPVAGIELVREHRPHLVLLDYFMPGLTGADVVRRIRTFDGLVQVLLITGYADDQPARRLLRELDIQGYHDKGDGPARMQVLVDASLKHYRSLARLEHQRQRLAWMVEAAPQLCALQPAEQLFQTALEKLMPLLGTPSDALVATRNNGLFVLAEATSGISLRAGIGRFAGTRDLDALEPAVVQAILRGIDEERASFDGERFFVIPMRTREGDRGCMLVERSHVAGDSHLFELYATTVTQALENLLLYEQATHDPLTRIGNRSYGERRLREHLQLATRTGESVAVLMVDLDHFKSINDAFGHAAGDLVLVAVAKALEQGCRATDVCSRYGGEEFLVVLGATHADGARQRAEVLRQAIAGLSLSYEGHQLTVTASLGVACFRGGRWADELPVQLVRQADQALYEAKSRGRDQVVDARDSVA